MFADGKKIGHRSDNKKARANPDFLLVLKKNPLNHFFKAIGKNLQPILEEKFSMAYPVTKPAHPLKGHKIFGKSSDSGIIPITRRVRRWHRSNFEYVHTCYKFDNMLTLYAIPFDLDLEKCAPRYVIDGKINAELVLNRLRDKYPGFLDVPLTLVRTKSGGISLLIHISPVLYMDENGEPNKKTQKTVWGLMQAQRNILKLLQNEGMGADEGAAGLARMVANYERPELVLYNNDRELLNKHRREKTNLLQILWKITKQHNIDSRIYNDTRVGEKLFNHFIELYEQTLEGRDLIRVDKEFLLDAGLDKRTVNKIISRDLDSLPWLEVVKREKGEFLCRLAGNLYDWELWENDAKQYIGKKKAKKVSSYKTLKAPHLVEDGERNRYLFSAAVLLTHETKNCDHVLATMQAVASKIPGSDSSRNCKPSSLRSIVRWAIKTSDSYRELIRNTPGWLWKIHTSLEARLRRWEPQRPTETPKTAKNSFNDTPTKPTVDKSTTLKYGKIGSNYAVFESTDYDYCLKLLGFVKSLKNLPSIANKLKYQDKILELKENLVYLEWFDCYQKRKHLLCGITKFVILHEPIVWDRLE